MHSHISTARVRGVQAFLALFCFIFAVNSAVHSYLVLRYSDGNKVAVNVGFYYMSNAAGRLTGTVLSGVLYSFAGATRADGFGWCFILSAAFGVLCAAITLAIRDDSAGLSCGSWTCVHSTEAAENKEAEAEVEGREEGPVLTGAPVAVEMRRGDRGSRDAGEAEGRAGLRWREDERVDEVRQRDWGVCSVEERPAYLEWDGTEQGDGAGSARWRGRFGRTGHLSYPGAGPPVRLRCCVVDALALPVHACSGVRVSVLLRKGRQDHPRSACAVLCVPAPAALCPPRARHISCDLSPCRCTPPGAGAVAALARRISFGAAVRSVRGGLPS